MAQKLSLDNEEAKAGKKWKNLRGIGVGMSIELSNNTKQWTTKKKGAKFIGAHY